MYEQDESVDEALVEAFLRASRLLVGVAARSLVGVAEGLTLPQFRALVVVDSLGTPRLSDVAAQLRAGLPSVSRLCDRLVAAGLLTRTTNPDNRREVLVALTPRARRLVERVMRRRRELVAEIVEQLDPRHRATLLDALDALAAAGTRAQEQRRVRTPAR